MGWAPHTTSTTGSTPDGPGGNGPVLSYCLMSAGGGGWTQVMNIDTNDGNYVDYNNTNFWTSSTNGLGGVSSSFTADYKNASVFAELPAQDLMIMVHEEGTEVAWRSWNLAQARTMLGITTAPQNTVITAGIIGSTNTNALDQYEAVVRGDGQLIANWVYGYTTSNDWSRLVNNAAAAFGAPNNHDDTVAGLGCRMNVSNGTNGSRWDAGYGWDGIGYQRALMGSDEVPGDPWATTNSRGLDYDYAIFVRD